MMRTACPLCSTVFRVTPEQLRVRAGKVRCGHCQGVFNALESLVDAPVAEPAPPSTELQAAPSAAESLRSPQLDPLPAEESPPQSETTPGTPSPRVASPAGDIPPLPAEPDALPDAGRSPAPEVGPDLSEETPEESAQAAREAGLAAARELAETPGYSRWSAGALAPDPLGGLVTSAARRPVWPFALAGLALAVVLAGQIAVHWRTEIAQRFPSSLALYDAVDLTVPLPRVADLVSIEASDLQADKASGLLILAATLRNRAAFPQSWPALELTLTDAQDAVVARRVLMAADYLPPQADPAAFAPGADAAVKLWIDAREAGAAGYRLYVFYP